MIKINSDILECSIQIYWKWKELNNSIVDYKDKVSKLSGEQVSLRKMNISECVSEIIACYFLDMSLNVDCPGDATDKNGNEVEIKATSVDEDLTSFSPNLTFDNLVFLKFDIKNDKVNIYDLKINSVEFKKLPVNKNQKVEDQCNEGKRPRLSLIQTVIDKNSIPPIKTIDLRNVGPKND